MTRRIARLAELVRRIEPRHLSAPDIGRSAFTRAVDRLILWIRRRLPWLHWAGATLLGVVLFVYAWVVGRTNRVVSAGPRKWTDLPERCVLAIWHGSAPSLLGVIAKYKLPSPIAILIATEPRGDALMVLCRLLGLRVIRGDWEHHGWSAVTRMTEVVAGGFCALITPDGGGPRLTARAGALVLAAAADAPLVAMGAECRPALPEPHKWDKPRNPLPFGRIAIYIEEPMQLEDFQDAEEIESARRRLEEALDEAWRKARSALGLKPDEKIAQTGPGSGT